jgi:hypothetical protein
VRKFLTVEVPNRQINIWLNSSLLELSPAVQRVAGLRGDHHIMSRVALVEDGDDLGHVSLHIPGNPITIAIFKSQATRQVDVIANPCRQVLPKNKASANTAMKATSLSVFYLDFFSVVEAS